MDIKRSIGTGVLFAFVALTGPLAAQGLDHGPVWASGSSITYNLRDLDNFSPLEYEHTRWGNKIDEVFSSFFDPTTKTLNFTPLTLQHDSSNADQDTWDLFLSTNTDSLNRILFPASPSIWDWNSREVEFFGSGDFFLFRYFHFESQPTDPRGAAFPVDKNKVIVLIHGWNRYSNADPYADNDVDPDEGAEFESLYQNLLDATAGTDWAVFRYDWAADADTGQSLTTDSTEAAEHGHQHGQHLGDTLVELLPRLESVHFIAHSAGSWTARGAARNLLDLRPNVRVEVTLLDPFMPNEIWLNDTSLGEPVMSALDDTLAQTALYRLENYYADDFFVAGTQEVFAWHPTVDLNFRTDQSFAPLKYDGHSGPIQWYADTIWDATKGELPDLLGYDLSTYGWRRSLFLNEPIIITSPASVEINIGGTGSITTIASTRDQQAFPGDSQSPTIAYQWYKWTGTAWASLPGQTGSSITLTDLVEDDTGFYAMIAFNDAGFAATNTVEVSAITFGSWISGFELIPGDQLDAEDDFDHDGFSNLFEYAFGMNPTEPSQAPDIQFRMQNGELSLTYNRLRGDITYTVQTSIDLVEWSTTGINQGEDGLGEITASFFVGEDSPGKRFLRLKVEIPSPSI